MNLKTFFLGGGEFKSPREIARLVSKHPDFNPRVEDPKDAELLLIFQTSKQQTWLVATKARLYCVLDDVGRGTTRIRWSQPAERLVRNRKVIVPLSTKDWKERTGLLDIGER